MCTFSDMMSLLLCFFILLLSVAKIDAKKYEEVSKSMRDGFMTGSLETITLRLKGQEIVRPAPQSMIQEVDTPEEIRAREAAEREQEAERKSAGLYEHLKSELEKALEQADIKLANLGTSVLVTFPDKVAFSSGSSDLSPAFMPTIRQVAEIVAAVPAEIRVAGHTDNIPISNTRFRSNWDLSTARAVSVMHELLAAAGIDKSNVAVEGYADTQPLNPNDTPENRAHNRRVEIRVSFKPTHVEGKAAPLPSMQEMPEKG